MRPLSTTSKEGLELRSGWSGTADSDGLIFLVSIQMACCRPLCPKGNEWDKAERMWNLRGPPFCKLPCTANEWNRQWNTGKACEPTRAQSWRLWAFAFCSILWAEKLSNFQLRLQASQNSRDVRFDKDIHIDAADIAPTAPWTALFSWCGEGWLWHLVCWLTMDFVTRPSCLAIPWSSCCMLILFLEAF